jgi:hypothetical protein
VRLSSVTTASSLSWRRHVLQPGLAGLHFQRRLVERDVQAQRGAIPALGQRVLLDDAVRQHRDLAARHVDRGQAIARDLVDRAVGQDREARRGDVHAEDHGAGAQAPDRQRVVDFRGLRIVDRERGDRGGGQFLLDRRGLERREAGAARELLEQEAAPVELVRAGDCAGGLEQVERRTLRALGGLDDGLVFGGVLVRLEQDLEQLVAHRLRRLAGGELPGPLLDLQGLQALALDAQQRGLDRLLGRLAEHALGHAAEVVRRVEQAEQRGGLLHGAGRLVEVVACQVGEAELGLAGELPGEVEVDLARERVALREQFGGQRLLEAQEDVRGLDLHTLAGVEFHLDRAVRLGHHPAGEELAGVIKESVIHPPIVADFCGAPGRPRQALPLLAPRGVRRSCRPTPRAPRR